MVRISLNLTISDCGIVWKVIKAGITHSQLCDKQSHEKNYKSKLYKFFIRVDIILYRFVMKNIREKIFKFNAIILNNYSIS